MWRRREAGRLALHAFERAAEFDRDGDFVAALRWLDRAARLAPSDPNISLTLSARLLEQNPDGSLALANRIIEQRDHSPEWLVRISAKLLLGATDEARTELGQFLSRFPLSPSAAKLAARLSDPETH